MILSENPSFGPLLKRYPRVTYFSNKDPFHLRAPLKMHTLDGLQPRESLEAP